MLSFLELVVDELYVELSSESCMVFYELLVHVSGINILRAYQQIAQN